MAFRECVLNISSSNNKGIGQLQNIIQSAFTGDAVIGGVAGATMAFAIKKGVSRGVFSNEAGIGSSAIVHATAKVDQTIQESLYGILEVFCDTIIICTFTALIIMTSGIKDGTVLATNAFNQNLGLFGHGILVVSLLIFSSVVVKNTKTFFEEYDEKRVAAKAANI